MSAVKFIQRNLIISILSCDVFSAVSNDYEIGNIYYNTRGLLFVTSLVTKERV